MDGMCKTQNAVGVVGNGRRLKLSQNSINIIPFKILAQNPNFPQNSSRIESLS